ncbi:MAG TPA: bifunctional UDP-N-acetylglucosamine diphosphorylase/glucosamine-1-phosphate N-acetyltransferase GlmU, partial [Anaerolineales bacterium]|nr:bifunctional UDP-N-acetylglucosamine diphosphorylase/glucosamine-1-phosphate N-acetyltransferase GlmU [Anaerolineales bacterium]
LGKPLIHYSLKVAQQVTRTKPVIVIGHEADAVRQIVGDTARFVVQEPQLGTGHAVQQAESLLRGDADNILVITADMPLLSPDTLRDLIRAQENVDPTLTPLTLLTVMAEDPRGFGRVVREEDGSVSAIVEEAQASPEQLAIRELNASVYCFNAAWLWNALKRIPLSPKGEYYLTDLAGIATASGLTAQALVVEQADELIGINNRVHLAEAEAALRRKINYQWMLNGVTMIDPDTTYIEPDVEIGPDTVIWPNTCLQGQSRIGEGCILGPNTILKDTQVGDRSRILASVSEKAIIEDDVEVGPFARLRRGAHLAQGVHMGNFGEIKNSYLGPGTKMGHFSYVGDATISNDVNIGAGTITCNYDGYKKHPTEIGAGAFIGSDTMLVAPVKLGAGARTGAGAVVTKDVPDNTLAVGVPARAIRKLEQSD